MAKDEDDFVKELYEELLDEIEEPEYDEEEVEYLEDYADSEEEEFDPWAERGLGWDDV